MVIRRFAAAAGVSPTWPTPGSVYVQWGMTRSDTRRLAPSRALATAGWAVAVMAAVGRPGRPRSPPTRTPPWGGGLPVGRVTLGDRPAIWGVERANAGGRHEIPPSDSWLQDGWPGGTTGRASTQRHSR